MITPRRVIFPLFDLDPPKTEEEKIIDEVMEPEVHRGLFYGVEKMSILEIIAAEDTQIFQILDDIAQNGKP